MANWSKNKTLPANVNNGNEFLPTDGVYSGDMNAAFNNAFYAVDYATALADTPDTSEVGNVGTPSVSLIDNVKDGKAYKKFKFANLKGEKGQDGKDGVDGAKGADGKNGVDGENGADGEPALAYGAAISLTTDTPSADISLPNLTFNRTPKLNDIFTAVASSSTNSYQVVYKIITEGSPQSTARPQSYVVTTGKQLAGGASLDGNNVFTGTNTFNQPITADTIKNSNENEIAEWDGTKQNFGSVDVPTVLRTSETHLKYERPRSGSTTLKETVIIPTADEVVDLTSYQEITGEKTFSGSVEMGALWVKDGKVQFGSASGSQLPVQLGSSVGEVNDVFVSQGAGKTPKWAALKTLLADIIYPVGAIYMTTNSANPSTIFPNTTWVAWGSGKVPVGVDTSDTSFNTVEKTGGEKTHTLTESEMPAHKHTGTESTSLGNTKPQLGASATVSKETIIADFTRTTEEVTVYGDAATTPANNTLTVDHGITAGGGQPHSILQPYITCYMWKRTV